MNNPSKQLVYNWINAREEKGEDMDAFEDLGNYFPEGPAGGKQVHVVVVTQDSV